MALEYPREKLLVYLSDDGDASQTLRSFQETWRFSRAWILFCREFAVENRCLIAFFAETRDGHSASSTAEYLDEIERIKREYERFRERLRVVEEEEMDDATEVHIDSNGEKRSVAISISVGSELVSAATEFSFFSDQFQRRGSNILA
nr:cellulose synthase-like protein G2 [Ipomoea batatas]GME13778.1 cellulose synthase-like protein G2 [Ipomoea batatas]